MEASSDIVMESTQEVDLINRSVTRLDLDMQLTHPNQEQQEEMEISQENQQTEVNESGKRDQAIKAAAAGHKTEVTEAVNSRENGATRKTAGSFREAVTNSSQWFKEARKIVIASQEWDDEDEELSTHTHAVKFQKSKLQELRKPWSLTLIGKCLGLKVRAEFMIQRVHRMWNPRGGLEVIENPLPLAGNEIEPTSNRTIEFDRCVDSSNDEPIYPSIVTRVRTNFRPHRTTTKKSTNLSPSIGKSVFKSYGTQKSFCGAGNKEGGSRSRGEPHLHDNGQFDAGYKDDSTTVIDGGSMGEGEAQPMEGLGDVIPNNE